jgi:hypothetical protein
MGQDSHLGGTALVELDGTLLELGLFIEGVPAEVDSVTGANSPKPVTSNMTDDSRTQQRKKLDKASSGDLLEGGKTVGDGRKGLSESRSEDGCQLLDKVSNNGEHECVRA